MVNVPALHATSVAAADEVVPKAKNRCVGIKDCPTLRIRTNIADQIWNLRKQIMQDCYCGGDKRHDKPLNDAAAVLFACECALKTWHC
jgi:hypothetical protein